MNMKAAYTVIIIGALGVGCGGGSGSTTTPPPPTAQAYDINGANSVPKQYNDINIDYHIQRNPGSNDGILFDRTSRAVSIGHACNAPLPAQLDLTETSGAGYGTQTYILKQNGAGNVSIDAQTGRITISSGADPICTPGIYLIDVFSVAKVDNTTAQSNLLTISVVNN